MHNAALAAMGLGAEGWRYQHLPIPPERFAETVRALAAAGFVGLNVTIPHKEAALALADRADETAAAVGAANTLELSGGAILASNTDVVGLLDAIPRAHDPRGRTALVLGAGGAARAAVHALLRAGAADVMVHNRTPGRARRLVADVGGRDVARPLGADLVVNATAVGLGGVKASPLAADVLAAGTCVVDMVYSRTDTELVRIARARGATAVDGLEVLVAQGAASLERWTGRPAPREVMRRAARGRDDAA